MNLGVIDQFHLLRTAIVVGIINQLHLLGVLVIADAIKSKF